ncbi:MAG: chemotaxis protein CheW [Gammaproteobacteria bacterium]
MVLLTFQLDYWQCAFQISRVERVLHAVAVTPLPQAPDIVLGIINVHGAVLPVVNIRRRFQLPEKKLGTSDQFIIARTPGRLIAIVVDRITGVAEYADQDIISPDTILPGLEPVKGILQFDTGLILIHDLDRFLSFEEDSLIGRAMSTA